MHKLSAAWRTMSEQEKNRYRDAAAKQSSAAARRRSQSSGGSSSRHRGSRSNSVSTL